MVDAHEADGVAFGAAADGVDENDGGVDGVAEVKIVDDD